MTHRPSSRAARAIMTPMKTTHLFARFLTVTLMAALGVAAIAAATQAPGAPGAAGAQGRGAPAGAAGAGGARGGGDRSGPNGNGNGNGNPPKPGGFRDRLQKLLAEASNDRTVRNDDKDRDKGNKNRPKPGRKR